MIQSLVKYTLIGIGLLLLQVSVVNNMVIFHLLYPHIYFLLLVILPFSMPQWTVLLTSFCYGLIMDFFTYTPGMHAAACVLAGFLRPYLLTFFTPIGGKGEEPAPHVQAMGFGNFSLYLLTFTFFHQFTLHLIEVFSLAEFDRTLLRTGMNTIVSWLLLMAIELIGFYRTVKE